MREPKAPAVKRPPPLPELSSNFLKYLENIRSASQHTLRAYRRDLSQALEGVQNLQDFRARIPELQLRWKALAPASRNRKAATLKSFCTYLFAEHYILEDWARLIMSPKVPTKLPHFISVDEALTALQWIHAQPEPGARAVECLFLLLYGGGLRVSEACALRWKDIDFNQRVLRIMGKGQKQRLVAVPEKTLLCLRERRRLIAPSPAADFIWGERELSTRVAYAWIRKLGLEAGLLRPLHPHALRHSFATHLLSGGANLRSLQELLGHTSLVATQRYTQVSMDDLARTLEARHPLSVRQNAKPTAAKK